MQLQLAFGVSDCPKLKGMMGGLTNRSSQQLEVLLLLDCTRFATFTFIANALGGPRLYAICMVPVGQSNITEEVLSQMDPS